MKINKSRPTSVWIPFFILFFTVFCLHADTGKRSLFANYPGLAATGQSPAGWRMVVNKQAPWRGGRYGPGLGGTGLAILGGVVGNLVGIFSGLYIANLASENNVDPIVGGIAGSVCGSTLGVFLAGRAGGCKGEFASALLGSLLGEAVAVALACAIPGEELPFLTGFFFLPPIGAAILFNLSGTSRSFQAGNGLLHLADGKLGVGMPDFQVRPLYVPGCNAKPEMQFNVKVLSVEL